MQRAVQHPAEETQVYEILEAYADAIRNKDARRTVAFYAADAVAYDLAPPLRIPVSDMRTPAYIQQWFDTWDGPIGTDAHDLQVAVGGDVAYACALRHMTGTKTDGQVVDLWFRATACLRREGGTWKITHVHNSVPFAMDGSNRALLDLKP